MISSVSTASRLSPIARRTFDGHRRGLSAQRVIGRVSDTDLSAHGLITRKNRLVGTELQIDADGETLRFSPIFSLRFRSRTSHSASKEGSNSKGRLRAPRGRAQTRRGHRHRGRPDRRRPESGRNRSRIRSPRPFPRRCRFAGPTVDLPDAAFSAAGGVTVNDGIVGLEHLILGLAETTATIDGHVARAPYLIGTTVYASIESPNIDQAVKLLDASIPRDLPTLPARPFSVSRRHHHRRDRPPPFLAAARPRRRDIDDQRMCRSAAGIQRFGHRVSGRRPRCITDRRGGRGSYSGGFLQLVWKDR